MRARPSFVGLVLTCLLLAWSTGCLCGEASRGSPEARCLATSYALLVGTTDLVPEERGVELVLTFNGERQWPGLDRLKEELKQAYRLAGMRTVTQYLRRLDLGIDTRMPAPAPIRVSMTLLGANAQLATYRVQIRQASVVLADTSVGVKRGGRAVLGTRAGRAAPYLFLVIGAPDESAGDPDQHAASAPRLIEQSDPDYPELAQQAGHQGRVVIEAVVGKDGSCRVRELIESASPLLYEAVRSAVEKWRFEPARDPSGGAIEAPYSVVIDFKLK